MMFHSIERLGSPFAAVAELGFTIPRDGDVRVDNRERKIIFFLQAECAQEVDGLGRIAVKSGDVLVVPRVCVQRYYAVARSSAKVHALKVSFSLPPLVAGPAGNESTRGDPEADLAAFVQHHFQQIRHLPQSQTAPMQEIMRAIRREAELHGAGIRHRVRALCTNLVVHVARMLHDTSSAQQAAPTSRGPLVNHVKDYLLRNFTRPATLGDVARHVRKSEEHVARVFKKVSGQTVFDYLRTVRLEHAKTLLIDSDMTLTEIAARTGFTNLALFSRSFSQYVGRSASSYRAERAELVRW
jgi:AraC-like DNA-binding protein